MSGYCNPIPTVDALILWAGGIVLVNRKHAPLGWALPGGFLECGETAEEAVVREIKEETGLDAVKLKFIGVFSEPGRDPRGDMISIAFAVECTGVLKAGSDASGVKVFPLDELPKNIAFDHAEIIKGGLL